MREAGRSVVAELPVPPPDYSAAIAALRQAGADRLDPLRLHYLALLQARASSQQGQVQAILNRKLAVAVAELQARLAQTPNQTPDPSAPANAGVDADADLAPRDSLADLTRALAQHGSDAAQTGLESSAGAPPELKSIRQFRNTWSKLSADKQVSQALDQAPKNAGPINSHMLVLRSLALMRDIAPDYLNRFMSYVDTLLCLDQHQQDQQAPASKAATKASSEGGKKPAARRSRGR
jgi:hypothetical protein